MLVTKDDKIEKKAKIISLLVVLGMGSFLEKKENKAKEIVSLKASKQNLLY